MFLSCTSKNPENMGAFLLTFWIPAYGEQAGNAASAGTDTLVPCIGL